MIVQACLNGGRAPGAHSRLPLSPEALARDGAACVLAGASELHLHPRDDAGRETLAPGQVDRVVGALRQACPGTLFGVTTRACVEGTPDRTLAAIAGWHALPDYASVNLSEEAAPAVMDALWRRGIGVEAGLASVADAGRLLALGVGPRVLRVLVEVEEDEAPAAIATADAIAAVLVQAGLRRPILLHGTERTVWPLVAHAGSRRFSTRVGLEDGDRLPDGARAADNASLVTAARDLLWP